MKAALAAFFMVKNGFNAYNLLVIFMYYLVGIKGSGMASLAQILRDLGYKVTGCDVEGDFYTCDGLSGIEIDSLENIKYDDNYVYIIGNLYFNSDISKVIKGKYEYYSYPFFVNNLFDCINIAISGTHGKTTTTKFLSCLLPNASYLIGDSEGYGMEGDYFIYEACEYKDNFLNYTPDILYVGNIDYDHPDYFKDIDDTFKSFNELSKRVKILITNGDDKIALNLESKNKITFGFNNTNDCVGNYEIIDGGYLLKIKYKNEDIEIKYPYYGKHMIYNFLGVYTILRTLGISNKYIVDNIDKLTLPKRRSATKMIGTNYYICDYAHHPNEILSFYKGIVENPLFKGLFKVAIFEAHTISRLQTYIMEYKNVLSKFDDCYIYDIFTSPREKASAETKEKLYTALGFKRYYELPRLSNSVICFLGAGNIDCEFNKIK